MGKGASSHILEKHKSIKADYAKLHKDGYRYSVILDRLAAKYFMAPKSIECLIWDAGSYKKYKKE